MRILVWSPLALDDLAAIDDYWWSHNRDRAEEILDRIEASGNYLVELPHAGPAIDNLSARKWKVKQTDYLLIFRIHPDRIEVLRVQHASQNWSEPH